ncbi:hypothetical protein [uncultured Ruminococcus sp.]|uniref:hypothetical protein n=1 Tax=uncultured Ruminococcus sp. TaxID=165186 RepID=UPI002610AD70|nr:hypothetical protein [uncultured Ruminococcus sp.]
MKKAFIAVITAAAAMASAAVSCGKKENSTSAPESTPTTETVSEADTTEWEMDEWDAEHREDMKLKAEEGIDITSQPFPECGEIPDDWQEISYEDVSMRIPPDLTESDFGLSYVKAYYTEEDGFRTAYIVDKMEARSGFFNDFSFPELTEEVVKDSFADLGIDYDGSRLSMFKSALSLTSALRTDDNEISFENAGLAKEILLSDNSEVYYRQINGHDVYFLKDGKGRDGYRCFDIELFVDDNSYYSAEVIGGTLEEALMMCSTIDIK